MSVLGRPQHDWDDFIEDAGKPKRWWSPWKVFWIIIAVVVSAAILIYYYREYNG